MKRERATRLLADMITRLEGGAWPLGLVEEVYVFGSYARGALEPNDVDVVIEHDTDERWLGEWALTPNPGHGLCGLCQRSWCEVDGVLEGDR